MGETEEARQKTLAELRAELAKLEDDRERVLAAIRALIEVEDLPDTHQTQSEE